MATAEVSDLSALFERDETALKDALAQLEPQASLLRDSGFPEIDNGNNYPALKGVQSIVLLSKQSWYQGNADTAANLVRDDVGAMRERNPDWLPHMPKW